MFRLLFFLLLALAACKDAPREPASDESPATSAAETTAAPQASADAFEQAGGIHYLVRYTGGATPDETLPMVVAIHGLGDRPERFALLRGYPGQLRVIVPRALDPHGRGFSWFPIRARNPDRERVARGLRAATDKVATMIEAVTKRYPTRGKPIVTGFSQGGMLSFALAVTHPELVAAALPVAGVLPEPMWPSAKAPDDPPPIVALHGDADPLLAIDATRQTVAALREAGFEATLTEYPGVPHRIQPNMRRDLFRHIHQAITP